MFEAVKIPPVNLQCVVLQTIPVLRQLHMFLTLPGIEQDAAVSDTCLTAGRQQQLIAAVSRQQHCNCMHGYIQFSLRTTPIPYMMQQHYYYW